MRTVLITVVILCLLAGCAPTPPSATPHYTLPPASPVPFLSPLASGAAFPTGLSLSPTPLPPVSARSEASPASEPRPFTFAVTADMRLYAGPGAYDTPQYFRGACEAIATVCSQARSEAECRFMISPGDIDPPAGVLWTITRTVCSQARSEAECRFVCSQARSEAECRFVCSQARSEAECRFPWYPAVGNHEVETPEDMAWLRQYGATLTAPDGTPVRPGPPGCPTTTYSFDYENAHFVVLNVYCDAAGDAVTDGDVPDHLYHWLADDLAATDRPHIFVFGHEPAYPQPDADTGRTRHMEDSLNAHPARRDRFWNLLRERGVRAYICGHTHSYSAIQVDGLWQLDAGHARGLGDTGTPSTFILVRVDGPSVVFETYRSSDGSTYTLAYTGTLAAPFFLYLPAVQNAAP